MAARERNELRGHAEHGRAMISPWVESPLLELDAGLPARSRFRTISAEAVEEAQRLLAAIRQDLPPDFRQLAWGIRAKTWNRFHAEATALGRLLGASWHEVLLASVSYEAVLKVFGCSTIVLPTASGPVLARNMDWWPEQPLAEASRLIRLTRNKELAFAQAGWLGAIGIVSGLSGRGFAVALNAVASPEGIDWRGYPVLLHLRRVVEDARNFEDAVKRLRQTRLMAAGLFTVAGTENDERVVIERTPTRCAERWGQGSQPLVATNDYRVLFKPQTNASSELLRTTCSRFDALGRYFAAHRARREVLDEELLYILSDPSVRQSITAQHVIFRPRQRTARVWVPRDLVAPSVSGT